MLQSCLSSVAIWEPSLGHSQLEGTFYLQTKPHFFFVSIQYLDSRILVVKFETGNGGLPVSSSLFRVAQLISEAMA